MLKRGLFRGFLKELLCGVEFGWFPSVGFWQLFLSLSFPRDHLVKTAETTKPPESIHAMGNIQFAGG
jgi:hypothetical protein